MHPSSIFGRHAEKFILAGPIFEGLVGGLSSFNGVVHAHGSRSKIFSTIQGIVFVGLAAGPWFSGLVLPRAAIMNVENAFALSISLLAAVLFYVLLLCPESREPTALDHDATHLEGIRFKSSPLTVIRGYIAQFISALLIPIAMFAPRPVPGRRGRNYNLTLVGIALFLYLVSIVTSQPFVVDVMGGSMLLAGCLFVQLGHYMSLLWITRAFNLLVFLPIVISYLKPKATSASPNAADLAAEVKFDKRLASASLAVDGLADALVALAPTSSQATYIGLSCLSSFTSGGNPSLHSFGAVCLHASGYSSETGALFGGMAVLSAIAHIINPYIYALTYSSTVVFFPKAIFVLAAGILSTAVLLLSGVSTRMEDVIIREQPAEDDEQTIREHAH
ncbi:hypothetical protein H0H87_005424 [Tephrocybe sp. NHM501043]|nr:hypothetical protein H0H87_005424 [Tephrocybe sp. NHM501043]